MDPGLHVRSWWPSIGLKGKLKRQDLMNGTDTAQRAQRYQGNISCKDGHNKGQKWHPSYLTYMLSTSREGNGAPLQYSCLENPMGRGAWWATVHGVAKSWTRLSDFTFTFHFHALEKEMATHSSVLAWRIPGVGEPGGLPSMGSHRVRHD